MTLCHDYYCVNPLAGTKDRWSVYAESKHGWEHWSYPTRLTKRQKRKIKRAVRREIKLVVTYG